MNGEWPPQTDAADLGPPPPLWKLALGGVAVAAFFYAFIWCFAILGWVVER